MHSIEMRKIQVRKSVPLCTMYQELQCVYFCVFAFCCCKMSSHFSYGCHLEHMTSYQKPHSVDRCVFTWRTTLLNFI